MPRGTVGAGTDGAGVAEASCGSADALAAAVVELVTTSTAGGAPIPEPSEGLAAAVGGAPRGSWPVEGPRAVPSPRIENATMVPAAISTAPPIAKSPSLGRRSTR